MIYSDTSSRRAGFTLVELIVVVTIMMLLLGGGLAMYVRLNNRQLLVNSGHRLQLLMRTAQKNARTGEKPTGCTRLLSYAVQVNSGQLSSANLIAECENQNYTQETLQFDNGVVSTGTLNMHFRVLTGGTSGAATVTLTRTTQTLTFTVGAGGDISELTVQ